MPREEAGQESESGLLKRSKPVFLAVGRILKPHALRGEVSVDLLSDFPERLQQGNTVYLGEQHTAYTIHTIRKTDKTYLISFKDHPSRNHVEGMRNLMVYVKSENLPALAENEYYHHDLVGLNVSDEQNQHVGILREILITGANDVYVIQPPDENEKEILVPAIQTAILSIDLENGTMIIKKPEWL